MWELKVQEQEAEAGAESEAGEHRIRGDWSYVHGVEGRGRVL